MFYCIKLIHQLRAKVTELQMALGLKDVELQEKDARIAELENKFRRLTAEFSVDYR